METKDWKHGLDIWHMERSDHAAAREDDGDATRRRGRPKMRWLDDLSTELKKIGIKECRDRARDRQTWRHIVKEASAHPGL
jgi:hypothetical protein